ncbi:hypothetical protein [Cephaloticoccus capnophilus]|uniref:hypothetical protein n=1 Tax=Cephaloticoccus capnophilus TaxID=1548208 RepID=UPI0012E83355|nr:hypothetical protein [Cephaloticoccus capnophilus]
MPKKSVCDSGFALVLVLSLVSLLMAAVYTISLISKVDAEIGATDAYRLQARQNALLGLGLAIAELQRAAGDSAAVTAPATLRLTNSTTLAYPSLTGVWSAGSFSENPDNWFVSGNFEELGPNQITPAVLPPESSAITLIGNGTVSATRDMARALRVPIADTNGGYAFWVGDEGAKAALAILPADSPLAPNGAPLVIDPRRDIPSFAHNSPVRAQPFLWNDLRRLVGSTNMKARFRSYTTKAQWVEGSALVGGRFNINTSNPISWEAVLRAYENARDPSQPELSAAKAQALAERLAANIGPKQWANAKPQFGPFFSLAAFWDSELVQESLEDAGITTLTQGDLHSILWPMLAVRSDTFRIRAYGDARNPADFANPTAPPQAAAYCEVIVQRTPHPDPLGNGLRFEIVYFRWLGAADI